MHVAVVINPVSGTGGRADVARHRAEKAAAWLDARGVDAEIFVTERRGHARELTRAAVAKGAQIVAAWGGDGTVNEVASAIVRRETTLAIIPSGSGNGLARELRLPFDASAALDVALRGRDRVIDAGELDGRLFFNVAGLGLDARVAHRFAANGLVRRGFARYLEVTLHELFTYAAAEYTIATGDEFLRERALLVAIANARQYGNGALIAPYARLDDGVLDLVVVKDRSRISALISAPRLFTGQLHRVGGVVTRTVRELEIASAEPVLFHVDGEPFVGGPSIRACVHPKVLRVRVAGSPDSRVA